MQEGAALVDKDAEQTKPPSRLRKKKSRRGSKQSGVPAATELASGLGMATVVWILLGFLAWMFQPMTYVVLGIGALVTFTGRSQFLRVAKAEGTGSWLACLLVPFYSTYFFLTRLGRTLVPFLIGCFGWLFLATGGVCWWAHRAAEAAAEQTAQAAAREVPLRRKVDEEVICQQLLAAPNQADALVWLKDESKQRGVFKWSRRQISELVRKLYQLGAKQVIAVNIETLEDLGGAEFTSQLVVVLPDEPDKRKALFDWRATFFEEKPIKDRGQKYQLVNLD
jgi:hypothetical protein